MHTKTDWPLRHAALAWEEMMASLILTLSLLHTAQHLVLPTTTQFYLAVLVVRAPVDITEHA